jgi:hypothetical protein
MEVLLCEKNLQREYENQLDLRWSYLAVVGLTLPFSKALPNFRQKFWDRS